MRETHLSVKDLAERVGLPEATVYRMNSEGTGPRYLRVGRYVRYRVRDVEAWEESRLAERGHFVAPEAVVRPPARSKARSQPVC